MKLYQLLLAMCLMPTLLFAQSYGVEVEVVSEDIGTLVALDGTETDLSGYSCYQVFITMENEDDFLSAIAGDENNPTSVTTTTSFHHSLLGGSTPNGIQSLLFGVYPDLEFDSWVTIGLSQAPNAGAGEAAVSTVQSGINPWTTNFDSGIGLPGGSIVIDDAVGGAWYALNGDENGIAGPDLKVLAGQFTTDGDLEVSLYTQIFINGVGTNSVVVDSVYNPELEEYNDIFPTFTWPAELTEGCTDIAACNYDDMADADDGSCTYPDETYLNCDGSCINDADMDGLCDELETAGCTDSGACNYNENATDDDGSCEFASCAGCTDDTACNYDMTATIEDNASCFYPEVGVDCDGNCINDVNGNGICDEEETFGCTDATACNYNDMADADDGSCTYPAADYVDCDGNCLNDQDNDGLCDEEEGCSDPVACNYDPIAVATEADYCLIVDTVMVHTEGDLAGMTTYRYYVKCANPDDFVSSVSGDMNNPMAVTTSTSFFHDALGGVTSNGIQTPLFETFPNLEYDSWVTIGLSSAPQSTLGEGEVSILQSSDNSWYTNFDPGFGAAGGDIVIDDNVGGTWFALNGDANGIAANHPDNQVLIAQLTTDGEVEGNFYVQVFENGIGANDIYLNFNIGEACVAPDEDCLYPEDVYSVDYVDCDGNCINDMDNDGVCDEGEVPGCTDMTAINFDGAATDDDGSCEYPAASVFDIIADSEVHTVLEDLIEAAELDSALTFGGAWTVFAPTDAAVDALSDAELAYLLNDPLLLTDVLSYHVVADSVTSDMLTNGMTIPMINGETATISFSGNSIFINDAEIIIADLLAENGVVHVIDAVIVPVIEGCTSLVSCNYNPLATLDDGSCESESCAGCLNELACNYDPEVTINDPLSCQFVEDIYGVDYVDCLGNCLNDTDGDGICDEAEVDGCTYDNACNYNPDATEDDGSCEYDSCAGCTEMEACNFDMDATIDDGTCMYPVDIYGDPYVDCDGNCLNDADGDGVCDENEIEGCLDLNACNYDESATDNNLELCDYSCLGCTDEAAANYDPTATIDDATCEYCMLAIDTAVAVVDVTCAGDMNGSITIEGTTGGFGTVNYAFEDEPFQSSSVFDQLGGGSYMVVAMDSLMCTDTLEVYVDEAAALQLFAFASDVDCNGDDTGSILVTSEGGTGVITFELGEESNIDGNFTGLDAGPYTVFATDANGCVANISAEVEEPDAIVITVDSQVDPNDAPNGEISVSVSGGTGDYSYNWEGPGGPYDTEDIDGLADGTYTLTVTDDNGCEEDEVVTLTTVGLTEVVGDLGIAFMPNPTSGQLTLELNQFVEGAILEVFDGAGRRVFRQEGMTIAGQLQMDFGSLSDGVYQVRLTAGNSHATQRLVVRH